MNSVSRREFIQVGAGLMAAGVFGSRAFAEPLGLPIGLQLYTVRDDLAKDFEGTLRKLAEAGYQEVEFAGFQNRAAADVRRAVATAGLKGECAHFGVAELQGVLPKQLEFAQALGLKYIVVSSPSAANPERRAKMPFGDFQKSLTVDDWKWNAEFLNRAGEETRKAGIQLGYHNHAIEFLPVGDTEGFHELLSLTEPALVTFELDCGWAHVAGHDPAAVIDHHADRISLLHIKDVKKGSKRSSDLRAQFTEVGSGAIDWKQVFAAAKRAGVKHYFVEQEAPFDKPPLEAVRISNQYLRALKV